MIIFIKGYIEALNYFIDCMAQESEDALILDVTEPETMIRIVQTNDAFINASTTVITFNNFGIYLNTAEGNYWERKQVKLYNIYMDHPINYMDEIKSSYKNMRFLMIDLYHSEFVKSNVPEAGDQIFFLPHAGTDLGLYANDQREIEVLYVGFCQSSDIVYPAIDFLSGKETEFYNFCYQVYRNELYFQVDNVVDTYIYQSGQQFTPEQRMHLISLVSMTVERQVMHDLKYMLLSAVARAGMHIQIHGSGWEALQEQYPDHITIGPRLTLEECIQEMGRTKIVLNMQPFFTYGGHDRIFNSMLNGAICVSNPSRYLEARFEHNKNILFADFADIDKTAEEMKQILEDRNRFDRMRADAYKIVQRDTWKFRLQQILSGNVEKLL